MISMVWLAGSVWSVLRRSDSVIVMLAFGDFDVGADREFGRTAGAGRHRLGAPDRRADVALALRIVGLLLVQHDALRDRGARPAGRLAECDR